MCRATHPNSSGSAPKGRRDLSIARSGRGAPLAATADPELSSPSGKPPFLAKQESSGLSVLRFAAGLAAAASSAPGRTIAIEAATGAGSTTAKDLHHGYYRHLQKDRPERVHRPDHHPQRPGRERSDCSGSSPLGGKRAVSPRLRWLRRKSEQLGRSARPRAVPTSPSSWTIPVLPPPYTPTSSRMSPGRPTV